MKLRKNIICVALSLLLIGMFGLTGCNTDKDTEKDPEGVITKDLKLADVEVITYPTEGGTIEDTSNGSFVLLKKFEEIDVSVYCYEEYKMAMGEEIHIQYTVLERDGVYSSYYIPVFGSIIEDDICEFKCYDYDDDGEEEIAATFVINENEQERDQKLFIFDYNNSSNSYDMYCLWLGDISEAVSKSVINFYKEQYGLEYVAGSSCGGGTSMSATIDCEFECEGENEVKYGSHTDIVLSDKGKINMSVSVFEALDNIKSEEMYSAPTLIINDNFYEMVDGEIVIVQGASYVDTGSVNCDVKYMGDGKFVVNASEYKEDTTKRNAEEAAE